MGFIESEIAVVYGRIVEGFRAPYKEDLYFKTVIVPGFSDGHMHPQVVDAGLEPSRVWSNSYEWLETRRLRVDEAAVRSDLDLSSRLAAAAFSRSLLEGVTLVAATGRLSANVRGWLSLPSRPRAIFLPTVMDRAGWPSIREVEVEIERLEGLLRDGLAKIGVFVHSLGTAKPESVRRALQTAARRRSIMGMHLSEGLPEAGRLVDVLGRGPYPARIVAVHCMEVEDLPTGVRCVSCPASNQILYRRTRPTLEGVDGFGSDWPLLIGTIARHLPLINKLYPGRLQEILYKATIGGYRAYLALHDGDFVAYDASLEDVLAGRALPVWVSVAGKPAVVEGRLSGSGYGYGEVLSIIRRLIKEAIEKHGDGSLPHIPDVESMYEASLALEGGPRS
ncbi:hypothetical protein apy_11740 [Aeropyrum pernix]|uniref:Uncharacterized protein n=1 Tax=Aeropyrum pernix TaxID=56636 RepID=A0A401HAW0_AERPX|nr:amidohydrolase family protein [Aeropyrum pernix]GBF09449.1 hypothetical protein apy_11740 [Aeropyrum pernix]